MGIQLEPWGGAILKWTDDKSEDHGLTVWHVAEKNTEWFSPSPSSFMINYRIDNMSEMLADLKRNGVEIWKGPESHENGKFAWIRRSRRKQSRTVGADAVGRKEQNEVTIGARAQEPPERLLNYLRLPLGSGILPWT